MRNVVIGFLGTQLDMGKRREWRPSVQLCAHPGFPVDRLELIHDQRHYHLACNVMAAITKVSPETEVRLVRIDMKDPWDFQEVYGQLYDFAADYGFDEDRERYHVHLTTGTHVAQICWFLLTESRHIPARLIQTGPPREGGEPQGTLDVIDLDLARYNALQRRFDVAKREHAALLLGGVETRSTAMQALIARLDLVAGSTDAPIFLLGEAGTGKSALASRLHELKLVQRRVKGRLVQVNCAALREGALPALLGQRRSAMGAAGSERPGFLREADGGVLFLDQIDDLPPEAQAALLQALETGRYCPVGSEAEVSVRLQLIASASLDPGALVRSGRLRPDLFARLSQWQFRLLPLRERREEVEASAPDGRKRTEAWPADRLQCRRAGEVPALCQGSGDTLARQSARPAGVRGSDGRPGRTRAGDAGDGRGRDRCSVGAMAVCGCRPGRHAFGRGGARPRRAGCL
jgi:transcriptional regulatory protein RtcR